MAITSYVRACVSRNPSTFALPLLCSACRPNTFRMQIEIETLFFVVCVADTKDYTLVFFVLSFVVLFRIDTIQ